LRLLGRLSGLLIIDKPVVVKPDTLSKKLFTTSADGLVSFPKGLI
jgi:hypothetical protein